MLKDIQDQVDEWVSHYEIPYWSPHEILAHMIEECGEIAREINHLYGPKPKKADESPTSLGAEIGDLLFAMCCLANSKGIDLDEVWKETMDKCYKRDNDRFEKKQ